MLIAIREDYVDGVDCLLRFEEENHKPGTDYSWESIDQVTANFTPDITPLILAGMYRVGKQILLYSSFSKNNDSLTFLALLGL